MITRPGGAALAALLVAACGSSEVHTGTLALTEGRSFPPAEEKGCEVAAHRCNKCHPLERVLLARPATPYHWERYVERMRLQPASGISVDDAKVITKCLVFRSFGEDGVKTLATPEEVTK